MLTNEIIENPRRFAPMNLSAACITDGNTLTTMAHSVSSIAHPRVSSSKELVYRQSYAMVIGGTCEYNLILMRSMVMRRGAFIVDRAAQVSTWAALLSDEPHYTMKGR
jgi:hypothetical protein